MIALLENTTKLSSKQRVPVVILASTKTIQVHKSIVRIVLKESMDLHQVLMLKQIALIVRPDCTAWMRVNLVKVIAANAHGESGAIVKQL